MRIRSLSRTMRQPSRSPWPSRLAWAVIAIATVVFVIAAERNLRRHDALTAWRQGLETASGNPAWPEWSPDWPALPAPPPRRHQIPQDLHADAYAARPKQVLQHIPCYCGCVREGHASVLNCFVSGFRPGEAPVWTDHSFSCPMCVHIAREVMVMSSQQMSLRQIRQEIERQYGGVGDATHTPPPTDSDRSTR